MYWQQGFFHFRVHSAWPKIWGEGLPSCPPSELTLSHQSWGPGFSRPSLATIVVNSSGVNKTNVGVSSPNPKNNIKQEYRQEICNMYGCAEFVPWSALKVYIDYLINFDPLCKCFYSWIISDNPKDSKITPTDFLVTAATVGPNYDQQCLSSLHGCIYALAFFLNMCTFMVDLCCGP